MQKKKCNFKEFKAPTKTSSDFDMSATLIYKL